MDGVAGSIARDLMATGAGTGIGTCRHCPPPSVDLKIFCVSGPGNPATCWAIYTVSTFVGSMASAEMYHPLNPGNPLLRISQDNPPSMLLKTPSSPPA